MSNSWRDVARPIIGKILWEHQGESDKEIRKALHDAYPFGERKYWPYKVWCDEVRRQRGLKPKKERDADACQGRLF